MAGIKDVAKRAGVGVGTVSRMLNNSGYVAEETREKIEIAMRELNYTPNELARNLYHKRTGIIAVLVPNVSNPFFTEFVDYAEAELYEAGFKMMLCNTVKARNAELEYLDMLNRHIVDGIITGVHSLAVEEYKKIKKPIVALDRYLGDHIPVVAVNHKEGGRIAAETLIKNGCRKILHFRGSTAVESPYHERHYEFEKIMKENQIETYTYELEWNRFDTEYYREAVEDVFAKGIKFDGVFAVDGLAIECMNETIRRHLKVPGDVKFVAYDGTFITEMVEPKVTAVVQPIRALARESVRLLTNLINGKKYENKQVVLEAKLRKGNTTIR
ncbi:LacI family DNA-binding transcriptional regulator [Hespellia stercorisuis]|uniref:Transcriptional regulator, LacI family n=1 Tax=Hespellia stercorisuis DSM 15480 TaxID=1121950 RepID=A0A1M6UIA0_9FIRM|nr:LacI family DNA-binding transcriptional regulator [Hespellia stercorisuis]SHK68818.1 transcriptional regulator, LacI family [Hespellia stercorisuis DSM 15480]